MTTFQGTTRRSLAGRDVGKDPCAPEQGQGSDPLPRGRLPTASGLMPESHRRPSPTRTRGSLAVAIRRVEVTGVGGDGVEAMVLKTPLSTFGCK